MNKNVKVKNNMLYYNSTPIKVDILKKSTNIDRSLVTFEECINHITTKYEGYDSITSKTYDEFLISKTNIMFDDENKIIYDWDCRVVIKFKGMNPSESYYSYKQKVNKFLG